MLGGGGVVGCVAIVGVLYYVSEGDLYCYLIMCLLVGMLWADDLS